jgi:hypothetical protein
MLCPLCRGSGNLFCFQGRPLWWTCSACGGAGVMVMHGPAAIACLSKIKGKTRDPLAGKHRARSGNAI